MYLLDANTYIQAKNLHYQMSFCPAYWSWLDLQYEESSLASIQTVYEELADGDDELSEWVKGRRIAPKLRFLMCVTHLVCPTSPHSSF